MRGRFKGTMSFWGISLRSTVWLAACLLSAAPPAAAEKRLAMVVGVNVYDNLAQEQQLKKAVNDARAMGEAFKDLGFEVVTEEDSTRGAFNRAWQRFLHRVEPGDIVAVSFSGHGVQIGGLNYLIPRDAPKVAAAEEDLLKSELISVAQMLETLQERRPRVTLMVLDACRNNPFQTPGGRSVGGARGLARLAPPEGTFVMYSAAAGEEALDRLSDTEAEPNSVYTRRLLPLLKTPGLSVQQVALKVRDDVRALASKVAHKQTPAYYDELAGPPVCLAGCEKQTENGEASSVAGRPDEAETRLKEAERMWLSLKDGESEALLQQFIADYGRTPFARYAEAQLLELRQKTAVLTETRRPGQPEGVLPSAAAKPERPQGPNPVDDALKAWPFEKAVAWKTVLKPKDQSKLLEFHKVATRRSQRPAPVIPKPCER